MVRIFSGQLNPHFWTVPAARARPAEPPPRFSEARRLLHAIKFAQDPGGGPGAAWPAPPRRILAGPWAGGPRGVPLSATDRPGRPGGDRFRVSDSGSPLRLLITVRWIATRSRGRPLDSDAVTRSANGTLPPLPAWCRNLKPDSEGRGVLVRGRGATV